MVKEIKVGTIKQLVRLGYPEELLRRLSHCEDFPEFGFSSSESRTATKYFNIARLDKYLEKREAEIKYW